MRVVILGDKDECLGFSLAGVEPHIIENEDGFLSSMQTLLSNEDIGIIIIVDRYFEFYSKHCSEQMKKKALPSVVFVPSIDKQYLQRDLKGFLANVLGIKL